MKAEEFHESLVSQGQSSLYRDIMRYQHVERLGSENVEGLLDKGPIVIQEKLDGANLTVGVADDGQSVICSRRQLIGTFDNAAGQGDFRGAVEYIRNHEGINSLLDIDSDWVLRGEWLVKHTLNYPGSAWNEFYVFDVQQVIDGQYVPVWEYESVLHDFGVAMVPLIAVFEAPLTVDQLITLADRDSEFGGIRAEGIVIKRYDFVNRFGRTQWGKIVAADFREKNKIAMGGTKHDPIEVQFLTKCVTDYLIDKVIAKVEDDEGRNLEITDMPRILGTVWHDAFIEELWDFVKRVKVGAFDFRLAQSLCVDKTRERVLARCSGSN